MQEALEESRKRRQAKMAASQNAALQRAYRAHHCLETPPAKQPRTSFPSPSLSPGLPAVLPPVRIPRAASQVGFGSPQSTSESEVETPPTSPLLQVTSESEMETPPAPACLRGTISVFGHALEGAASTDRFSDDERSRALALLRLKGSPTKEGIHKARRLLARECHPDKLSPHLREWGTKEIQRLNWAVDILLADPKARPQASSALPLCW